MDYPSHGDGSEGSKRPRKEAKYRRQVESITLREKVSLDIDLDDLKSFDEDMAKAVVSNTRRFVNIFSDAVQEMIPEIREELGVEVPPKDTLDVYIEHRILAQQKFHPEGDSETARDPSNKYPAQLMRRFEVYFTPMKEVETGIVKPISVRAVKAGMIGKLVTIKGIVTRVTEVKPMITVATYTCDQCGSETYQPVSGPSFTPLEKCSSVECRTNKSNGRLYLQTRGSRFVKFQELKVQEHSDQVPVGNIPRSVSIVAKGEQVGVDLLVQSLNVGYDFSG